jgi:TolB-like protein/Tfp pilus assembly protein PilF
MHGPRPHPLIARLRERGVLRVAASYVVIAWLVLQIADVVLEPWDLPRWVQRAPQIIALIGFPIAVALAWFFELGGGHPHRDTAPDGAVRPQLSGWRHYADIGVISVLAAIVAFFVIRDAGWLGEEARPRGGIESSSLAVLPFASVGVETDRYVTDGLSDELRNQFSRMQSLSVTARSSSVAFQDQALDAVTIAGKLAVAALLEGTVTRSGGRLQVAVQLVDGRSGKVLWAERFDRPDRDLIAVQSEIASAVVAAVLPRFAASGKQAPPPPTQDPVAYDLYLLGRQKLREVEDFYARADDLGARTAAGQAAEHFRAAIANDPRFAQAHASLALAKLTLAHTQIDESTPEAQAAAMDREVLPDIERALELDPANAEAYFAKGRLLRATYRPGAESAFRRAVELDPSNAPATVSLGYAMLTHGHVDERYRLVRRALELDPMDLGHHNAAIMAAWIMAKPDEVRALTARMLKLFPDHPRARLIACEAYSYVGQPDEAVACAIAAASEFVADPPLVADTYAGAAWSAEELGDRALMIALLERAGDDVEASIRMARIRDDREALRRAAVALLEKRPIPFDALDAHELALAGLVDEAIDVFRRSGLHEVWSGDTNSKPFLMHPTLRFIALLRARGLDEEAAPTLARVVDYLATMRRHGARSTGIHIASAKALAMAGQADAAYEQMVFAADRPDATRAFVWIEGDAAFAELDRDPRIPTVVQRLREKQTQARERLPETFRRQGLDWPWPGSTAQKR